LDAEQFGPTTDNFEVALYPDRDPGNDKVRRISLSTLVVVSSSISPICFFIDAQFSGVGAHPEAQILYLEATNNVSISSGLHQRISSFILSFIAECFTLPIN